MSINSQGQPRTHILVDHGSPVVITSGSTLYLDLAGWYGGRWSVDCHLDGGGSGLITPTILGANWVKYGDGTDRAAADWGDITPASGLPTTDAAALAAGAAVLFNVENQNTTYARLALAASGADVTLAWAVLRTY